VSALKTVIRQEFNVTISTFNRDPAIESSPIGVISTVMAMAFYRRYRNLFAEVRSYEF
jgi:hypothetical protein